MPSRGFTLFEIVLAVGLSGAVMGLLATAINLYLVRVDANRSQVETAQLARALLNQLADDIQAARYVAPQAADDASTASPILGIFGTTTDLRIDRAAIEQWEMLARRAESMAQDTFPAERPPYESMPQTVRYVLGDGKELLAAEMAERGVQEQQLAQSYAGLYREQTATAAWIEQNSTDATAGSAEDLADAELFAPEVVSIEFAYFDGEALLTEWDCSLEERLPDAIEIRLTLLKEPFAQLVDNTPRLQDELRRDKDNLVEYRRFVRVFATDQPHDAEFPQQARAASEESGI